MGRKVFSMLEEIYSREWYIEKGGRSRKYKGSSRGTWEKNECWSKKARKVGYDGGKEF